MSALKHALKLAAAGIPVFPCRDDKAPACAGGFKAASTDPAVIRRLFADGAPLIGVPTGAASGLDVLDLDPRNGSEAWWANSGRLIPPTLIHDTRSGGMHVLFKHQPGLGCSNGGRTGPRAGVDIKADGGYVIHWPAAGCSVAMAEDVAPWPPALLDGLAVRSVPAAADVDTSRLDPPSLEAVVELLTALPNPLEVDRDDYARVMLAAAWCEQATGDDGAIGDAAIAWAERWEGGSARDERGKWESDWSRRTSPGAGWPTLVQLARKLIPGYVDPGVGAEFPPLPPLPGRKLFVSRDFKVNGREPYVVKHLLAPGNVGVLLGQPGAGKSTLAPHLAYAVAQGRPVFGIRTTAGRALYVAAEDLWGVQKRIGALGLQHGHSDDCAVVEAGNLRESDVRAALLATVADFKPSLIVLDTVAAAFAGMDENTSADMGLVVSFARQLAATGAAVLLIHHPAKASLDGTARGHGVLQGTLDMAILLAPDDVGDADTIVRGTVPKNRNGTTARDLAFRKQVVTLGRDDDGDPITTTLPVEVDAAAPAPVNVTDQQRAFLASLQVAVEFSDTLDTDGHKAVAEDVWIALATPLSSAANPADRVRAARILHSRLVRKGLIHVVNGMSRPAIPALGLERPRNAVVH